MSNEYKDWLIDKKQEVQTLIHKYPFIGIRNKNGEYYDDLIWLDDMPVGWAAAFGEQMCDELLGALGDYAGEWKITQLKEKYGELRIYHSGCPGEIYYEVEAVIDKYIELSQHTCFRCGKTATKHTSGWIVPVCDECYERYQNV